VKEFRQEVEGMTVLEGLSYRDVPTQVHVILVDKHWWKHDDVFFKHYAIPNSQYL
jgi:hypothetical protein